MDSQASKKNDSKSYQVKLLLDSLEIKRILQKQLAVSVILLEPSEGGTNKNTNFNDIGVETISWRRLSKFSIAYRTPIALSLASEYQISPAALAQKIIVGLPETEFPGDEQKYLDFTVQIKSSGWIEFYLSNSTLAQWLQYLVLKGIEEPALQVILPVGTNLFPFQYTHARCCSLLRLGEREGLIKLQGSEGDLPKWLEPQPIPLFCHSLRLQHRAAHHLLDCLVNVIDAISSPKPAHLLKRTMNLSQGLLDFARQCRICGEITRNNRALAQSRLSLIAACQICLHWLLLEKWGVNAPLAM